MSNYKNWCPRCDQWKRHDYDGKCISCGTVINDEYVDKDDDVDFYEADFMNDFGDS